MPRTGVYAGGCDGAGAGAEVLSVRPKALDLATGASLSESSLESLKRLLKAGLASSSSLESANRLLDALPAFCGLAVLLPNPKLNFMLPPEGDFARPADPLMEGAGPVLPRSDILIDDESLFACEANPPKGLRARESAGDNDRTLFLLDIGC